MTRRTKRISLPRLTVLAWDKRTLRGFLDAVETLAHRVEQLEECVDRLTALPTPRPRRRPPLHPADPPAQQAECLDDLPL